MTTTNVTTQDGRDSSLSNEMIESFRAGFRGTVLSPADPGYDEARRLWNGMHDKHPAVIVRCTGTADVVAAVNFARDEGIPLSVRGGGHNVAGNAIVDGGLVIDLSEMRGVNVDPTRRTARAAGGVTWGEFDRETQLFGLATPGGEVTTTGIAGFTLGGGMGVIRRKFGLTCDNLLSADVVTADGRVLTASNAANPDLFWGIRGGGGNFGVVTSFEFQLHPLGPEIYTSMVIFALEDGPEVIGAWRDFVATAPDEVTCDVLFWSMPPFPGLPDELIGAPIIAVTGIYAGSVDEGAEAVSPLMEFGTPLLEVTGPTPYLESQQQFDVFFPDGGQYYWKSLTVDEISDDVIDMLIRFAAERPSPQTPVVIRHLGGAIERVPEDATAYGNRSAQFNISIDSSWEDPTDSARNIEWTRNSWQELNDLTGGGIYLNFAGFAEDVSALARAGHQRNYERLREVKRHYDPMNLFRSNINIKP